MRRCPESQLTQGARCSGRRDLPKTCAHLPYRAKHGGGQGDPPGPRLARREPPRRYPLPVVCLPEKRDGLPRTGRPLVNPTHLCTQGVLPNAPPALVRLGRVAPSFGRVDPSTGRGKPNSPEAIRVSGMSIGIPVASIGIPDAPTGTPGIAIGVSGAAHRDPGTPIPIPGIAIRTPGLSIRVPGGPIGVLGGPIGVLGGPIGDPGGAIRVPGGPIRARGAAVGVPGGPIRKPGLASRTRLDPIRIGGDASGVRDDRSLIGGGAFPVGRAPNPTGQRARDRLRAGGGLELDAGGSDPDTKNPTRSHRRARPSPAAILSGPHTRGSS